MIVLSVIIFSLVLFKSAQCGEFTEVDGRNYYISNPLQKNWYQAYRYCSSLGMYLLDIQTEVENARVRQLLYNHNVKFNITQKMSYWTSGTDLGSEDNFYWMTTGQQVLYSDWYDTNPDNWLNPETNETENCLFLYQYRDYKWDDKVCSEELRFICRDTHDMADFKIKGCSVL